jgi:uncharacterized membrane protein
LAELKTGTAARRPWTRLALPVTVAAAFAVYTALSVAEYQRLGDNAVDLGIFTEYVKRLAHLQAPVVDAIRPGENLLGDHFHPAVALVAPFFRLFPSPLTLLVAQALLIAVSIIPVSRAATELLGRGAGQAIAVAYGFSWGLQELVDFEFHELAFAVPLLAFSLSALVRRRPVAAACWALPLVLVKEDQGLAVAVTGLLIAIIYRQRMLGLAVAAWGVLWSFLAVAVIIPHFNPDHVYRFTGKIPVNGNSALIESVLHLFAAGFGTKVLTLVMLLLPTLFLALRSPLVLVAVPALLLRFVSADPGYWGLIRHYNGPVMPVVFLAAVDALWLLRQRPRRLVPVPGDGEPGEIPDEPLAPGESRRRAFLRAGAGRYGAAVMAAVCLVLAFSHPVSALWDPATYRISPRVIAVRHAIALVPDGATVASNTEMLAPLGARADAYWLGNAALYLGNAGNPATEYVVYDKASPDFGSSPSDVLGFVEAVSRGAPYNVIYARDGVFVFVLT